METGTKITHKDLVLVAYEWVLKCASCGVAFKEFKTYAHNREYPDVIGFGSGHSCLVECKATRADFLADAKKLFRKHPSLGMGRYRYYCVPEGLIDVSELPEGWGLIYVNDELKARVVYKPWVIEIKCENRTYRKHYSFEVNLKAEHQLMYSALRRLHIRGRIDEVYKDIREIERINQ